MKIATMVYGKVPTERRSDFEKSYSSVKNGPYPLGLEQSFLLRSLSEPGAYLIETIWSSREALDKMRSEGKPVAVALFEQVGATPRVEIHEIAESVEPH